MKASIILSSYNNLSTLKLSIESLRYQTEKNFEIIIADDGSTDGTIEYLEKEGIKHFSRPNEGYRLAYIWNRGAELAKGDRFIFSNSDIISHPKRVEEHLKFNNHLVAGIYPSIPIEKVPLVTSKIIADQFEDVISLATHDRRKDFIDRIKRPYLIHEKKIPPRYMYGGNWSCPANTFKKLEGLDEGFIGWGAEDFDFARRAELDGHNIILNANCIGYHLDHETVNRDKTRSTGKGYFNKKWSK
jgi:glycosyltransferase involved in cell wall biosynthesis